MKPNVTIQETIFKDMVNQLYKNDARIKELEDTIRDLLQMLYKVPPVELSWSDVETMNEIKKKIVNKE